MEGPIVQTRGESSVPKRHQSKAAAATKSAVTPDQQHPRRLSLGTFSRAVREDGSDYYDVVLDSSAAEGPHHGRIRPLSAQAVTESLIAHRQL